MPLVHITFRPMVWGVSMILISKETLIHSSMKCLYHTICDRWDSMTSNIARPPIYDLTSSSTMCHLMSGETCHPVLGPYDPFKHWIFMPCVHCTAMWLLTSYATRHIRTNSISPHGPLEERKEASFLLILHWISLLIVIYILAYIHLKYGFNMSWEGSNFFKCKFFYELILFQCFCIVFFVLRLKKKISLVYMNKI